jgi:predicted secreted acid phosphatase
MKRLLGLLLPALALALVLPAAPAQAARPTDPGPASAEISKRRADVPSRDQWLADVKTAMAGSRAYVRQRVAERGPDEKLAINFDIDNTVLATYYDGGGAIPLMARFSKFLQRQGVAMVFNTGRVASQRSSTLAQLKRNGFPVAGLCLRGQGKTLIYGKQRCRDSFAARGWTLIANVGNNDTDFSGDGYEKAYVLPNYGGELG